MAKKFGRIADIRIVPDPDRGKDYKRLVEQFNQALERYIEQTNTVLDTATRRLVDASIWMRGERHTIGLSDYDTADTDYTLRHKLGVVPRDWIIVDVYRRDGGVAIDPEMIRSDTAWNDTRVYFKFGTTQNDTEVTIYLLP